MNIARRWGPLFALALGAVVCAIPPVGLKAQQFDEAKVRLGKGIFQEKSQCFNCHGWAADGNGSPQSDRGPSLRATKLTRAQLAEVINCGRPAALMPAHDRLAYVDARCYGLTAADLGDKRPPQAFNALLAREVDAVIEYLFAKVIGRGAPSFEECEDYFGPRVAACNAYKRPN